MRKIKPLSPEAPILTSGLRRNSYDYDGLISCARGELFGPGNAQLPLPPMLMFDRIMQIEDSGGKYDRGILVAELDINPELWFFDCHFRDDPVMPGCLGLDAMWQLIGFFLAWRGGLGRGRALGAAEVQFTGQVTPDKRLVTYRIDIRRVVSRSAIFGVADGTMEVDGELIYTGSNLRVGLFTELGAGLS
jgi:3-hydroxyacyl-[acyl-carrier protein] dehydratase/trans-2-decenoyl-[acyl-carrier protein] isomerase